MAFQGRHRKRKGGLPAPFPLSLFVFFPSFPYLFFVSLLVVSKFPFFLVSLLVVSKFPLFLVSLLVVPEVPFFLVSLLVLFLLFLPIVLFLFLFSSISSRLPLYIFLPAPFSYQPGWSWLRYGQIR